MGWGGEGFGGMGWGGVWSLTIPHPIGQGVAPQLSN
jgi:hypothetical protein